MKPALIIRNDSHNLPLRIYHKFNRTTLQILSEIASKFVDARQGFRLKRKKSDGIDEIGRDEETFKGRQGERASADILESDTGKFFILLKCIYDYFGTGRDGNVSLSKGRHGHYRALELGYPF